MTDNEERALDAGWEGSDAPDTEQPQPQTASKARSALDDDEAAEDDAADSNTEQAESETSADAAHADDSDEGSKPKRRRRRRKPKQDTPYEGDERSRIALDFISKVLAEMEMDCGAKLRRPKDGNADDEICIEIVGKDAGRIIGKKGQVLAALQFLTHRVINRPGQDHRHVFVDAEGYRARRDTNLATMARRLGKQAVDLGKIITFEPMNPRDRRVVHLALAKFEGVITKSDGEGDDRRVQIIPVRR